MDVYWLCISGISVLLHALYAGEEASVQVNASFSQKASVPVNARFSWKVETLVQVPAYIKVFFAGTELFPKGFGNHPFTKGENPHGISTHGIRSFCPDGSFGVFGAYSAEPENAESF